MTTFDQYDEIINSSKRKDYWDFLRELEKNDNIIIKMKKLQKM